MQKTLEACKKINDKNDTLLTSIGQNTWNFQLFCGTIFKLKMKVVVPSIDLDMFKKNCEYYKNQFNCNDNLIELVFIAINTDDKNNNKRDQYIIDNSEIIFPISIRKNGFFYNSLKDIRNFNKINKTFEIDYASYQSKERKKIYHPIDINHCYNLDKYLIHWTRKPKYNWPYEKQYDYYMSILEKENRPRTAFDTLCNILDTMIIYSSSRHSLKNCKMVSFTGSPINHFISLMKWRTKYNEMSYEPYGIGIDRDEALKIGFIKVSYCNRHEFTRLSIEEKKLYHSSGTKTNWSEENEFRFFGDLNLIRIPKDKIVCICQNSDETSFIEKKYGIKSYSLY